MEEIQNLKKEKERQVSLKESSKHELTKQKEKSEKLEIEIDLLKVANQNLQA